MKKKVLVFGGAGFLGSYVVNKLLEKGYDVIVPDISTSIYFDSEICVKCDILNRSEVESVISEHIRFIYNFAGFASLDDSGEKPYETVNLNIIGNLNILEACKNKNIERYIYASSAYAMSDKGSFYGISKLASEKLVEEYYKKYNLKYTIIRYGSVYGERDFHNNYIYNLIKKAIEKNIIEHNGDGEEIREYIHAADAAKLSVDIIEDTKFENEHLILTGVEKMKRKELFLMIKEIFNDNIEIIYKNLENQNHYKITPYSFHPSISKKLTANPFIDMGQGILECIKEIHRNKNLEL